LIGYKTPEIGGIDMLSPPISAIYLEIQDRILRKEEQEGRGASKKTLYYANGFSATSDDKDPFPSTRSIFHKIVRS
jgi:hypothetical protein